MKILDAQLQRIIDTNPLPVVIGIVEDMGYAEKFFFDNYFLSRNPLKVKQDILNMSYLEMYIERKKILVSICLKLAEQRLQFQY